MTLKRLRKTLPLLALCVLATPAWAPAEEKLALPIKNFLWINTDYCTGGQPRILRGQPRIVRGQPALDDLAKLKAQGVRAIINLRRPSEYDHAAEQARAKQLGLRYFNLPVDSNAPIDAQAEEFLKLMADPENRPAFIHCASANRVGAFWMIWRVRAQGWTLEDAEKEAERIGLRNPRTRAFVHDFLARQPRKPD